MPAGSTPRSVETSVAKLRISRPAPSSRTSERATSATTRPWRIQPCLWLAPVPLPDSFIPLARSWREAFHAGTMPTISRREHRQRQARDRALRARVAAAPRRRCPAAAGWPRPRGCRPRPAGSRRGRRPSASRPDSVSRWAMMRSRPPPSAARSVISRSRVVARASSMLATLQHAMSRSRTTAPSSVNSTLLNRPTTRYRRSSTSTRTRGGYWSGYSAGAPLRDRRHPLRRLRERDPGLRGGPGTRSGARRAASPPRRSVSGTHMSGACHANRGGITPMIVRGVSPTVTT